jgi:hypothetical protein
MSEPIDDMQEPFDWFEEVAHVLDEVDSLVPELLDRKLPKKLHERLHFLLLNTRLLKENNEEYIH